MVALVSRIREKANRFILAELEEQGIKGIVPSHGDIFYVLFRCERCAMKDLAEKIHRTKPTVTVLVDKLVNMGYVVKEKCPEDGRVTYIKLTPEGERLKPLLQEISAKMNERVYQGLNPDNAEKLEQLLHHVNINLD